MTHPSAPSDCAPEHPAHDPGGSRTTVPDAAAGPASSGQRRTGVPGPLEVDLNGEFSGSIGRLAALAQWGADMHQEFLRLAARRFPGPEVLVEAPVLQNWRLVDNSDGCVLEGEYRCISHAGASAHRSDSVIVLARYHGWARTLRRFYRLGRPA